MSGRRWLRIAVVAWIAVAALKWLVVDVYAVRGNSMQPLLVDRAGARDAIAVLKPAWRFAAPERFDLAVFRWNGGGESTSDLEGDLYVKRVFGLPGEQVLIEDGDVFVIGAGGGDALPAIPRRDVATILDMQVEVDRMEPGRWDRTRFAVAPPPRVEDGGFLLDAGGGEATVGYHDRIATNSWVDAAGAVQPATDAANDVGVDVEIEARAPATAAMLELREQGDRFVLEFGTAGVTRLSRERGAAQESIAIPPLGPLLAEGQRVRLRFLNVDDRILLLRGDEVLLDVAYGKNEGVLGRWRNDPGLAITAGCATLRSLRVVRDAFFTTGLGTFGVDGKPFTVPADHYFLLGDNSANSKDSREFGAIPRNSLRGRPWLRVWPPERFRRL